eukprot:860982-Rhodomonas_salina.1
MVEQREQRRQMVGGGEEWREVGEDSVMCVWEAGRGVREESVMWMGWRQDDDEASREAFKDKVRAEIATLLPDTFQLMTNMNTKVHAHNKKHSDRPPDTTTTNTDSTAA